MHPYMQSGIRARDLQLSSSPGADGTKVAHPTGYGGLNGP